VDNIRPAVERALAHEPELNHDEIVPRGIEENVWQSIEDLFMCSTAVRELVKSGKTKVVGAIYDVGTGAVLWLPESRTEEILKAVEMDPACVKKAMADEVDGAHSATVAHTEH
jgi:carbonic anhydrase